MDKNDKLFIGLDVGTDSVGWAVTNENYELTRLKGKTAWGARIFEKANPAQERRQFRTAGRRLARRKERVRLLNALFDPLLKEKDPTFLMRLEASSLYSEDVIAYFARKKEKTPNLCKHTDDEIKIAANACNLLFLTKKEEKDFYAAYPTIWHLRKAMVHGERSAFSDIRYVYLAIHHIVKYRGNFLRGTGDIDQKFDNSQLDRLNELIKTLCTSNEDDASIAPDVLPKEKYEEFQNDILENDNLRKVRKSKVIALFNADAFVDPGVAAKAKRFYEMFCSLCVGLKFSTDNLNEKKKKGEEAGNPEYEKEEIEFDASFENNKDKIEGVLGDAYEIVGIAKSIYDYCDLCEIMGKSNYLSEAFSDIYDEHAKDLRTLKKICKELDKWQGTEKREDALLYKLFKDPKEATNYPAYIHVGSEQKRCSIEDFCGYVGKLFEAYTEGDNPIVGQALDKKLIDEWMDIKKKLLDKALLKTISIRSTSVIPMQLHKKELYKILDNAKAFGVAGIEEIEEKIKAIFEFKIPYFCGPLVVKEPDGKHKNASKYTNVEFKDGWNGRIFPWNFEEAIDIDKTKENFMNGLTNKCTYLPDANVLPMSSLLFQDYDTWNKLNNLSVNGKKLSPDEMNALFKNFLSHRPKSTMNDIKRYLKNQTSSKDDDVSVSGLSPNDYINCSSRAVFGKLFGLPIKYDDKFAPGVGISQNRVLTYDECERIIYLKTIFTDSDEDANKMIEKEGLFKGLSNEQQKAIKSFKCKGWCTLSKEFLTLSDGDDVKNHTIIGLLQDGQGNLNQILNDAKYGFLKKIEEHKKEIFENKTKKEIVEEMIDEMPPAMRRPVIQAVRIVEEICKAATGKDKANPRTPDSISIEVTREDNNKNAKKKKETKSRQEQLKNFLKNLSENASEKERAKQNSEYLDDDKYIDAIKGKHLFLYFLQNGRDLYSGEPIDIDKVMNGTDYDTDHIIPQSMMKDDSIENLALVKKETNQHRSNQFPVPVDRAKMASFWRKLKKAGMMSEKKYNNLMRTTPLTENELEAFVAAQINVVNRANKVLKDIFKILYPNAESIFSKALYPSLIRKELQIPKLRDLNDTHHAVDAYLNIVTGNELRNKFGDMRRIKAIAASGGNSINESLNMQKFLEDELKNKNITTKDGEIIKLGELIDKNSRRHDFLLTYRFNYSDSGFYDQTLYAPGKKNDMVPIHDDMDPNKYGGYSGMSVGAQCIVTIKAKKKTSKYILGIPHMYLTMHLSKDELSKKLIDLVPYTDGDELIFDFDNLIDLNATIKKGSIEYVMVSKNKDQVGLKPVSPIFLNRVDENYIAGLSKFCDSKNPQTESNEDVIIIKRNREGDGYVFSKTRALEIVDALCLNAQRPSYSYCPMISNLLDDAYVHKLKEEIIVGNYQSQLKTLKKIIGFFTRNSETLSKTNFRKSRGSFLDDRIILVNKSITGLFVSERKL